MSSVSKPADDVLRLLALLIDLRIKRRGLVIFVFFKFLFLRLFFYFIFFGQAAITCSAAGRSVPPTVVLDGSSGFPTVAGPPGPPRSSGPVPLGDR